jgi:hypothetical protein
VQRGSVEIAVGHRLTACYKIRAVICSLPRASLLLGAGFGLLSRAAGLALQLPILGTSESMGHHDSEIMDDRGIDRDDA